MKKILVIHGPNLNLLGQREISIYGTTTIDDINVRLKEEAKNFGVDISVVQSNHEGEIVTSIGNAVAEGYVGILINPAAYTHTSVAIHDAIRAINIPTVEVHLSNIYAREEFRHTSLTAPAVCGQVSGFGVDSYLLGLRGLVKAIEK